MELGRKENRNMEQIDIFSYFSENKENNVGKETKKKSGHEQSDTQKELEQFLAPADDKNIRIGELFIYQKKKYIYLGVKAENHMASKILAIRPKDLKKCSSENTKKYIQEFSVKEKELERLHIPLLTMPGRCTGYWLHFPECDQITIGDEIEDRQSFASPCWLSKRKVKRISKELGY